MHTYPVNDANILMCAPSAMKFYQTLVRKTEKCEQKIVVELHDCDIKVIFDFLGGIREDICYPLLTLLIILYWSDIVNIFI